MAKAQDIQFYNHTTQELTHSQRYKIKRILRNNRLQKVSDNLWLCRNVPGYNKRTYSLKRAFSWERFSCNCQRGRKGFCAHLAALEEHLKNPLSQKELW